MNFKELFDEECEKQREEVKQEQQTVKSEMVEEILRITNLDESKVKLWNMI